MSTNTKKYFLLSALLVGLWCLTSPAKAQNINRPNINCPGNVEVNSYTGNLFMSRNDLFIKNRKLNLNLTFYYNSSRYALNQGYGKGWSLNYLMRISTDSAGVIVATGDGREDRFTGDTSQVSPFVAPKGNFDSLVQYQPGKYLLITPTQLKYFFDNPSHRRLTRVQERNGNVLNFQYTDSLLTTITDSAGRSIQLNYTNGRLSSVAENNGTSRTMQYQYDQYGNLATIVDPLGHTNKYEYLVNGPMSEVTDKNGNGVNIIYQPNFAVKEVISCNTQHVFSYNKSALSTTVVETVEGGNQVSVYTFDTNGYLKKKSGNCCGFNVSMTYDNNGNMVSFTNANGQKHQYTYDSKGRMLSAIDALGNTSFYTYEPVFGNLTSYRNRNGAVIQYSYDNKGNLTQASYPLNITNTYLYNALGDLISMTDGKGNSSTFTYDSYGNITGAQRPLGSTITLSYDLKSRMTSYVDPNGNTTEFTYDLLDRPLTVEDPLNNSFVFTYDANGNILTMRDRKMQTSAYAYDALDRPVSFTNALNQTTAIQYDARGNILSITRPDNTIYSFGYDHLNRLISTNNPLNEIMQYAYDGRGNRTSMSLPNGNLITYSYDALNRLTAVSDAIGPRNSFSYDLIGNLTSVTDANGNSQTYAYDALSRKTGVTDAMGNTVSITYDQNSNRTSITDRKGKPSQFTYDALNRTTSVVSALNHANSFVYDLAGNLTSVADAKGNATAYAYDALNRNTLITYADGSTNSFAYDPNGNITTFTDGKNISRNMTFDALNRLLNVDFPGTNDDAYTFDVVGNLSTAVNADATVNFSYDATGRIIAESLNGKITSYNYNIPGNKVTLNYPGGRSIQKQTDLRGRLINVSDSATVLANFIYDPADRLISKVFPANNTQTNYTYDGLDRINTMITGPGNMLSSVFTYDANGNKLSEVKLHKPEMSEQYAYDDDARLIEFKRGTPSGNTIPTPDVEVQYTYDALGNRVSTTENGIATTYTSNAMNAYTAISGNINSTPVYDGNGNVTNDGVYTYSYDDKNRMASVNSGAVATYKYDALGRRIQKNAGGNVVNYAYSGIQEIENYNGSGQLEASYVFGYGIDKILSADLNNTRSFYYSNSLGSVNALAGTNGAITERYEYDPFGSETIYDNAYNYQGTSMAGNNILYTGRTLNTETGNYYYRARTYNDNTGRFEQRDPLSYNAGDMNLYGYVFNMPLRLTDSRGTSIDCGKPKLDQIEGKPKDYVGLVDDASDAAKKFIEHNLDAEFKQFKKTYDKAPSQYHMDIFNDVYELGENARERERKAAKALGHIGDLAGGLNDAADIYNFLGDPTFGKGVDIIFGKLGNIKGPIGIGFTEFDIVVKVATKITTKKSQSFGELLDSVDWGYGLGGDPYYNPCE